MSCAKCHIFGGMLFGTVPGGRGLHFSIALIVSFSPCYDLTSGCFQVKKKKIMHRPMSIAWELIPFYGAFELARAEPN